MRRTINHQKESYIKNINNIKKELEDMRKKKKDLMEINKKMDFSQEAKEIVSRTRDMILEEIREKIEEETRITFFNLLWKKSTFKNVTIDNKYNINLMHTSGFNCLGTVGAAERELLALSFTLALHKISGFKSPILIDTPVARIDLENRENFASIFSEVGKEKQTILLFTPAEYSENIVHILDEIASNKYTLKLMENEKETVI